MYKERNKGGGTIEISEHDLKLFATYFNGDFMGI